MKKWWVEKLATIFQCHIHRSKIRICPRLGLHPSSSLFSFVLKHKSFYISKGFVFECILTIYAKWRKLFEAPDDIDLSQYLHHLSILKILFCVATKKFHLHSFLVKSGQVLVKGIPEGKVWQNHKPNFCKC